MRSDSSGRVVPKTCKSWLCRDCSPWLRDAAMRYLNAGAAIGTDHDRHGLTFLTLTDTPKGDLDMAGLHRRWKATQKALARRGWLHGYAQTIELQERGALHPHVIVRMPRAMAERLPSAKQEKRDRWQWRWHFNELVPLVRELGWGPVCDWRQVGDLSTTTEYAAKSLARYATKEAYKRFKDAGARRIRPVRSSRDWVPGRTLTDFQQGERADPGPWRDVTSVCGRL